MLVKILLVGISLTEEKREEIQAKETIHRVKEKKEISIRNKFVCVLKSKSSHTSN